MTPLGQPRVFGSVYQEDPLLFTSKVFLSQTEMATTVGATLASSKLAVTQGDLHLIGSPVDQLVLYFDQAVFDKFLATARVKANKPKRHRHQARTTGAHTSSPHPLPMGVPSPIKEGPRRFQTTGPSLLRCGPVLAIPLRRSGLRRVPLIR